MITILSRLCLLGCICLIMSAGVCADIRIVDKNKPGAVIVLPRNPLPCVNYAAQELQYHIEQSTGIKLDIISESNWDKTSLAIVLGDTLESFRAGVLTKKLPANGYIIRTSGNRLFIAGDDSAGDVLGPYRVLHENYTHIGTLLGVYHLLKSNLGVKWLWPGKLGEVIPKRKSIVLDKINIVSSPKLIHTRIRDGVYTVANPKGWSSYDQYARYTNDQTVWLRRQGMAMALKMDITHSFTSWWERYSKSNPEFFNLLPDGSRRSNPYYWNGDPLLISMCVSEPKLWKQIAENWKYSRSKLSPYLDASENDTTGDCTCERCIGWDVPNGKLDFPFDQRLANAKALFEKGDATWVNALGNLSDRYARFYLEVQKEARKIDPNVVVMGFAYANYTVPPVKTKLNDKVIVAIVPALMFPWTQQKIDDFRKQWDGWAKSGCRLMLRPNYTLDGGGMPIFYARKLGEDLRFAAKHGMIATDFDSLTGQWAAQGPNLYVLVRLQVNPELTVNQVLDEYYTGFGPAAKAVKEYFSYWEKVSDSITDESYNKAGKDTEGDWARFIRMAGVFFTPEVLSRGSMLLEKAAKAASGDPAAAQRVEFLSRGLEQVKLSLAVQTEFNKYKATANIQSYRKAINDLDSFRLENETWNIANMGFLSYFESMTWDRTLVKEMDSPGEEIAGTWKFMWDPENVGLSKGWQADVFDTSAWLDIVVGTNWEAHDVGKSWQKEHGDHYNGTAWYRKDFSVKPEQASKEIKLLFGAVDEACKVYLNGKELLDRPYPFEGNTNSWQEAFSVDIKPYIRTDKPNSLAVRVEDSSGAGGIWRPVWIVIKD